MSRPFTSFNFKVEIILDGQQKPLCNMAFSECTGLEMTITPKTIQEGGNNGEQIHLMGQVTYGQLTLRRGMSYSFDLWDWFDQVASGRYDLRARGIVVMLDSTHQKEEARFILTRCFPVQIKAPELSATSDAIAIEELQIAYERMRLDRGTGQSVGGGATRRGVQGGVSVSASGFSANIQF